MRCTRVRLSGLVLLVFLTFCLLRGAYAQTPDLNLWVGKWFKMSVSGSGYCIENSGFSSQPGKFTMYLNLWNWDLDTKILSADLYELKNGEWKVLSLNFNYYSGTELNFLFWFDDINDYLTLGGTGQITGKLKRGVLTSGKFNVPTGYHKDYSFADPSDPWYCTGLAKFTGTLISIVPVPPGIILH